MTMTYAQESEVAQRVLARIASGAAPWIPGLVVSPDVRGARVQVGDATYVVHRMGNELRFHEAAAGYGGVGRYLIVQVGEHQGGWITARSVRPPGEYHDDRAAEQARQIVERVLWNLGYEVGTTGREGRVLDRPKIERDVAMVVAARPGSSRRPATRRRSR